MRYRIERTSLLFDNETKPCEKALKSDNKWYIDINSIEDLQEIVKEVGCSVIVSEESLEIYDDFRE